MTLKKSHQEDLGLGEYGGASRMVGIPTLASEGQCSPDSGARPCGQEPCPAVYQEWVRARHVASPHWSFSIYKAGKIENFLWHKKVVTSIKWITICKSPRNGIQMQFYHLLSARKISILIYKVGKWHIWELYIYEKYMYIHMYTCMCICIVCVYNIIM